MAARASSAKAPGRSEPRRRAASARNRTPSAAPPSAVTAATAAAGSGRSPSRVAIPAAAMAASAMRGTRPPAPSLLGVDGSLSAVSSPAAARGVTTWPGREPARDAMTPRSSGREVSARAVIPAELREPLAAPSAAARARVPLVDGGHRQRLTRRMTDHAPGRNTEGMMRDLLYLSENKMRALIPQLPGQLRRRLGFEAGLNVGVASARASLPGEPQPSSIALLDAVVEMIEQEKGSRWRTDPDLRAGDWVQFEEEFRYGDAATKGESLSGLVYFAATDGEAPFVLCGSSVHVLDRWQPGDGPSRRVGHFYMDALLDYARALAGLPDEAAVTEFTPPLTRGQPAVCPRFPDPCRDPAGSRLGDRAGAAQRPRPGPRRGTRPGRRAAALRARYAAVRPVRRARLAQVLPRPIRSLWRSIGLTPPWPISGQVDHRRFLRRIDDDVPDPGPSPPKYELQ